MSRVGRDSSAGIVTRLRVGRSEVRIPADARDLSLIQNLHTGYGLHPASYSGDTGVPSWGLSGRSVKLTTHHLVPRSRINGVVSPLQLYSSKTCKGVTWAFTPKMGRNTVKLYGNMFRPNSIFFRAVVSYF